MKDKKDGGGLGRIIDCSFLKIGFGEELGELTRVSAGNPFQHLGFDSETIFPSREIGEAIPAFHLQILVL